MSFPISFTKFEAIPLSRDPAKVLIRWEIKHNRADLSDFEFYVDRGDAPDQLPHFQNVDIDGKALNPGSLGTGSVNQMQVSGKIPGTDFYQWVDATPLLRNLSKNYHYRIRARRISTQEEVSTLPFSWSGELDVIGLYIVEEHNFLLEDAIGVPSLIYSRRRSGIPCTGCFDPIQKKRTASFCTACFGTNWLGGFYNPIDAYIDFSPNPSNSAIADWGETQSNETDVLMSNYPEVEPGDVIRELRTGKLWRVSVVRQTEKRRVPMLQFVRVSEILSSDVEHQIPYDYDLALSKVSQLEGIRSKREF